MKGKAEAAENAQSTARAGPAVKEDRERFLKHIKDYETMRHNTFKEQWSFDPVKGEPMEGQVDWKVASIS